MKGTATPIPRLLLPGAIAVGLLTVIALAAFARFEAGANAKQQQVAPPVAVSQAETSAPSVALEPAERATGEATSSAVDTPDPAPVAQAGMIVYRDPETGEIGGMPPASELPTQAVIGDPRDNLTPRTLPDGSVMVDLQGQLEEYTIIEIDAQGHRVTRCVQDPSVILQPAKTAQREDR